MYLVSVELRNVRAIAHMVLDFGGPGSAETPRRWTVLFGENGCGKSTVLKAIGLVLAGSEALPDLLGSVDEWVRNGADQAEIRAVISTTEGKQRKISLVLRRGDGRDIVIKKNATGLNLLDAAIRQADRNYFVAGYGAFRRPPDPDAAHRSWAKRGRAGRLATLFLQDAELVSIEQWALGMDASSNGEGFAAIGGALATLLPGMKFKKIDRQSLSIVMSTIDGDIPLRQLSEGYQAMAAWAGDLLFRMSGAFPNWKSPLSARGVLLIDEMDLHLHPLWKRSLVEFLNQAFPRLQIIATTHSPLSVQQCGEGELFVIRRETGGPTLLPFVGDPSNLRLSELFLSPLIGLDTLDSPRVAALRQEARNIELKPGVPSAGDLQRLKGIQKSLSGTTPLVPEEAPQFARLKLYQDRLQALDPSMRVMEAETLYSAARSGTGKSASTKAVTVVGTKKLVVKKTAARKPQVSAAARAGEAKPAAKSIASSARSAPKQARPAKVSPRKTAGRP